MCISAHVTKEHLVELVLSSHHVGPCLLSNLGAHKNVLLLIDDDIRTESLFNNVLFDLLDL